MDNNNNNIYLGIDIGSTTIKAVAINHAHRVFFSSYERHNANIREKLTTLLASLKHQIDNQPIYLTITGSIGMGIAEHYNLPFIQEVVSATRYMQTLYPQIKTLIDIGGEDAKVVFFRPQQAPDLRMNGNCAGGTGSFIDQMAVLLHVSIEELNEMALRATHIYPIASRCGVFCKTDIQNLLAKNANRNDIAASIFHAVAVQTVVTLSHGQNITPPMLFCGGPLTFIPALRKAFTQYLQIDPQSSIILPEKSHLIPAFGAALAAINQSEPTSIDCLIQLISQNQAPDPNDTAQTLKPLFQNPRELQQWQNQKLQFKLKREPLKSGIQKATIGIDSGSTTTKIILLSLEGSLLFSYYAPNNGNPIQAVRQGLLSLQSECNKAQTQLSIVGSCSTGYGEDLIKAAFQLNEGIIETIAHYLAARCINPQVSFILDIGGQDMKAIFVENQVINHIEINEACSSGCGTFIETFANTMQQSVTDFAHAACLATHPSNLGTRCTVFMNSKVKQVLRQGATIGDIAAGLAYSVINNCLHKVLNIHHMKDLGSHIVVQGGTMHNDSVVRALELLTGANVFRSDCPELMGAYGCALHAQQHLTSALTLSEMLHSAQYDTHQLSCHGCSNSCLINRYTFGRGAVFYSGNKCERIFSNKAKNETKGRNLYEEKLQLLFDRPTLTNPSQSLIIGIPRVLNQFEEYPFWHTLFSACGFRTILSEPSNYKDYELGIKTVMSDNICFPAKLVHSHLLNLVNKVDRIFLPYVVYEKSTNHQNSFNCPIVSGYSDVVRSSMNISVPIDSPTISFKNTADLQRQLTTYLQSLGVPLSAIRNALKEALRAQSEYESNIARLNREAYHDACLQNRLIIVLAGRPYHSDPLIQHKLSETICAMGADCLTADIVRQSEINIDDTHFVSQWAYPELILKAAKWTAQQNSHVQFIQLTSFGCGPDAFLLDEIHTLLTRYGKSLTRLKIDDINNIGSLTLRVRSVIDSFKLQVSHHSEASKPMPFITTPHYTQQKRETHSKIIIPNFTSFITPLIPSFMRLLGYDADVLPLSNSVSDHYGLEYANNEICYPATLIVGDIIKAFKSGQYDPNTTTALITQTGGQCRASNYISLIKKALVEAGYKQVPVVSLNMSSDLKNNQPAFKFNTRKIISIALTTILYTDALAKLYYASAPRETIPGSASKLMNKYLELAKPCVEHNHSKQLLSLLTSASQEFNTIVSDKSCPRVGIVGEIFLKFNAYAQRGITDWLVDHHIEPEPPLLCNFFLQSFVNSDINNQNHTEHSAIPQWLVHALYKLTSKRVKQVNKICSSFRYYHPIDDVYTLAQNAQPIVSLSAQYGEGWLLPGEVATMTQQGIHHVISLQPFGCIANHIVAKGIEKRLRSLYPNLNFLCLDFDSGVSEVNIKNRLLLFVNDIINDHSNIESSSLGL